MTRLRAPKLVWFAAAIVGVVLAFCGAYLVLSAPSLER